MLKLMRYLRREMAIFIWGIIFLLLGSASQFFVPLFIGRVIDAMSVNDFDSINYYCLELAVVIVV